MNEPTERTPNTPGTSGTGSVSPIPAEIEPFVPRTVRERACAAVLKAGRKVTVRMYRVRGLAGLADRLRRAIGPIPLRVLVHDFDGTLTTDLDLSSELGSRSFWSGYYERWEIAVLKTLLRPGDVFIDCGANIGEFTLVAAKAVGPEGRVLAFEPQRQLAERLRRIVARNGLRNVLVDQRALGDRSQQACLATPVNVRAATGLPLGDMIARVVGGGMTGFAAEVACLYEEVDLVALDDAYPAVVPSVLKIDVEGAELPLLRGAERSITTHRPAILLELNAATARAAGYEPVDLVSWLETRGYRLFRIRWRARLPPFMLASYQQALRSDPTATENLLCLHGSDPRITALSPA